MLRKFLFASIVMLALVTFITSPAMSAKSYSAEQYDVVVQVQPDGSLIVNETVRFRFEGGPFTYVFRDLAFRNLDAIDQIHAGLDGQPLPEGSGAGQVEIKGDRPLKVTWHFNPTSNATRTFSLSYRVLGAIRHDITADMLIWRAIPEEHEYKIANSTIQVMYPPEAPLLSAVTINRANPSFEAGEHMSVFSLSGIEENQPVDVTLRFQAGSLVNQPPAWQARQEQNQRLVMLALPYGLAGALLALLLCAVLIARSYRGFQREGSINNIGAMIQDRPPKPVAPALAARLTGSSTGFLGTLFDLAHRGSLRIQEAPKKWTGRSFEVARLNSDGPLAPHEVVFMQILFQKAKADHTDLGAIGRLANDGRFSNALDQEMVAAGLRDQNRQKARRRFLTWTGLGFLLGVVVLLAGVLIMIALQAADLALVRFGGVLIGAAAGWSAACLVGLIVAAQASTLSDEGARQAVAWKSFAAFLKNITRGREPGTSPDLFERYLPYAAAFGLATEWAKYFQNMSQVSVPDWFQSLQPGMEDGSFIAIIAAISAADSSASSAASAGSAGASGGGASGAG